jgi:Peptidase family M23
LPGLDHGDRFFYSDPKQPMPNYLHGIHDTDLSELMAHRPGWLVPTVAIGHDAGNFSGIDFSQWKSRGFSVIVRINNAYGSGGTVPLPSDYPHYAARCANFVAASRGIERVIISNEPNIAGERPNGVYIYPADYARCFRMCRDAIKAVNVNIQVLTAAIAPYNADSGDCMAYYREMMGQIALGGGCDGMALHAYTRSADPADITSLAVMADAPLTGQYSGFLTYQDQLDCIPAVLHGLPAYISEFDEYDPWVDANTGVVQAAYQEIDRYNHSGNTPLIHALCLFRSVPNEAWTFYDKPGVQADFSAAVNIGYETPTSSITPPEPPVTAGGSGEEKRDIDPRLIARGVVLTPATVAPGQLYWRVTKAEWFNEQEAQGRHNTYVTVLDENGQLAKDINVRWYWGSGHEDKLTEVKHDPWLGHDYSCDFGMYAVAPAYGVLIAGGSDDVWGMGLGSIEQPDYKIHTAYSFTFELVRAQEPLPIPPLPPLRTKLIWPVEGYPVTQWFGSVDIDYTAFGIPAHDGVDFGCPAGTPVVAPGDGIVKMVDNDERGYGLYIRTFHPATGYHSVVAHLSEQHVAIGQRVKQGDTLGLSGNTGNSTGDHCHYEGRIGNENAYYELHDRYGKGRCNPLIIHAIANGEDPNLTLDE